MVIRSNIRQVIARVEKLKAAIPVAMQRALTPDKWEAMARQIAEAILRSFAQPNEQLYVPAFVNTITVGTFGQAGSSGSLFFRMHAPIGVGLADVGLPRGEDADANGFAPPEGLADAVLRWVQAPEEEGGKRRDERDVGKSDEEIAHLITYILIAGNLGPKGRTARTALIPHIETWLQAVYATHLKPETVRIWLAAVMAGWREMMRLNYRDFMRAELAGLMK